MALIATTLESTPDSMHQARVDLAAAHRLAYRFGFDDGIHNHFTLMVPGATDRFLVKAHGLQSLSCTREHFRPHSATDRLGVRHERGTLLRCVKTRTRSR